jgi:hypothetical protein
MKTEDIKQVDSSGIGMKNYSNGKVVVMMMVLIIGLMSGGSALAHCDSYDGPVIRDARKAIATNNVDLVLKWVSQDQEEEIISLFSKTYDLKNGDSTVFNIVETHFLETLVRLHRETEGAAYTGLKPAGTTKPIIQLSDAAISAGSIDDLAEKLTNHISNIVYDKYRKVLLLDEVKDDSVEKGREFVEAYVDYTHTLEAIHDILEGEGHRH